MTDPAKAEQRVTLYKYVSIARLRDILGGVIRFSQPGSFNDPFELLPEIVMAPGELERKISVSFDILAPRRTAMNAVLCTVPDGFVSSDPTSRDIVRQLDAQIGILSLSRVRNSLLMWSHYADQYAGALIEFDGDHEFLSGQIDVEYRSDRPRRPLEHYLAGDPIPLAELCAKSEAWAYEREVRVARPLADCERRGVDPRGFPVFVRAVPTEVIRGVILGERTPVEQQREIFDLVKNTRIALSLAAVDLAGYAFREERIKFGVPVSEVGPMMSPRTAHIFTDGGSVRSEFARWMVDHHPLSKVVNKTV